MQKAETVKDAGGRRPTHGFACRGAKRPKEYVAWGHMVAKGSVYKKWVNSFLSFLSDVGYAPSKRHKLYRIDKSLPFAPGNVTWRLAPTRQPKSNKKRISVNGESRTKEYQAWIHIKMRCNNPSYARFKDYGGRGISVCDRWLSYNNFLSDMGRAPSTKHTIDRINNDGNYEPNNCRWATWSQQHSNKRGLRKITYKGESKTVAEWARGLGVHKGTILYRLNKGWDADRAVSELPNKNMIRNRS